MTGRNAKPAPQRSARSHPRPAREVRRRRATASPARAARGFVQPAQPPASWSVARSACARWRWSAAPLDLQVISNDFYRQQGDARSLREIPIPTSRGMITDRNGEPLAVSTPVESIWANPQELLKNPERIPQLAKALGVSRDALTRKLSQRAGKEFVYLKRRINPDEARRILAHKIPGVFSQREFRRFYPQGEAMSHILGFTNIDDLGQEGLELAFDDWLRGKPGAKRVIRDGAGRIVESVDLVKPAEPGHDLTLTIDRRIQYLAFRELRAHAATHRRQQRFGGGARHRHRRSAGDGQPADVQPQRAQRRQPRHASQPRRHRRDRAGFDDEAADRRRRARSRRDHRHTRASTPIRAGCRTAATAPPTTTTTACSTPPVSSPRARTSARPRSSPRMPEPDVLRLPAPLRLRQQDRQRLPRRGRRACWRRRRAGAARRKQTMSYGYGLSATPLQIAQAYAALGNGGRLIRRPSSRASAHEPVQVLDPAIAGQIMRMMQTVTEPGGTATQAAILGYHVAGKTGTARKFNDTGGYSRRYVSFFAGVVPVRQPALLDGGGGQRPRPGQGLLRRLRLRRRCSRTSWKARCA